MLFLLTWYLAALAAKPLEVKAVTSAVLAGLSDVIAQQLLGARKLSYRRCLMLACFGLCWYGPSNHAWQSLLVRLFPPPRPLPGTGASPAGLALFRLAQRVGLDQLVYAPLNNCLMIFYVALAADQRGWAAACAKAAAELPGVQRRGWRLWPAVQLINQSMVPLELRVLVNNLVAVCWTSFVILRARGVAPRKLPVFNLSTGRLSEKVS